MGRPMRSLNLGQDRGGRSTIGRHLSAIAGHPVNKQRPGPQGVRPQLRHRGCVMFAVERPFRCRMSACSTIGSRRRSVRLARSDVSPEVAR